MNSPQITRPLRTLAEAVADALDRVDMDYRASQRHPTPMERRALRIVANNRLTVQNGGMTGCMEMLSNALSPETLKRRAAETLAMIPANRAALVWMGRPVSNAADARALAKAGELRRLALKMSKVAG